MTPLPRSMLDVRCWMFDVPLSPKQTNIEHPTLNIEHRTTRVPHRFSGGGANRTTRVPHRFSGGGANRTTHTAPLPPPHPPSPARAHNHYFAIHAPPRPGEGGGEGRDQHAPCTNPKSFAPPPLKRWATLLCALLLTSGCAPSARLTFPRAPLSQSPNQTWYDTNQDAKPDFALLYEGDDANRRATAIAYDDDQDGQPDRVYRFDDYPADRVPHLIVLLDSIPYQQVADAYAAGDFRWFDPPQKVIAPFPSLTEICYADLLHTPPLPGIVDQYWEPKNGRHNGLLERAKGNYQPWERRLDYHSDFVEQGLAYLNPRPWHAAELERIRQTFDKNPDRVTIAYATSASGMMCKLGHQGLTEILDDLRQLCLQVLHERRGAVKISVLADHGHNLMPSTNIDLAALLDAAGFRPGEQIESDRDVVVEVNGLVTYAGIHTRQPAKVADALLKRDEIELATYMDGDAVIVRSARGTARITSRNGIVSYQPIDADVLDYAPVLDELQMQGKASTDGFATDADWFAATKDHSWPDAPRRLWDAFHTRAVRTPAVMLSLRDGTCAGLASFARMIDMQSSHGGLNQLNSATFVLTMTGRAKATMRTKDLLPTLEPHHTFGVKR